MAHPDVRLGSNGRKYFLHLLTAEQLAARGISAKNARLVINAYPVLVLSNEWLEELFCPVCKCNRWYHVTKHDCSRYTMRWAPQDLWEQVAHVDPVVGNPSVSQYTRREARRHTSKRSDGKRIYDPG